MTNNQLVGYKALIIWFTKYDFLGFKTDTYPNIISDKAMFIFIVCVKSSRDYNKLDFNKMKISISV